MIGKTISHYKILKKLGRGGMGIVYKVQDTKLDRFVALKFLPPHFCVDEEEQKRFIQEAKAASALQHNNICTIHEINEADESRLFICMDFYEGETLKDKIAQGPLEKKEALDFAIQIAQGLAKAHEKDIIHRDIKPANIMITTDGVVKILDFGLAKLAGQTRLTKSGSTLGTVAYMSPEQTQGENVDHRSDIWSLGVVLYEMLTGQLPFKGDYEQATMYSILNEEPEPLTALRTGVPMELERVVRKCLHKDYLLRYQHVDELIADLKALQKSEFTTRPKTAEKIPREISGEQMQLPSRKSYSRWYWLIPIIMLLFLLTVTSYVLWRNKSQETANTERRIVVLPFENLGASDDSYFSEGVTEEITSRLASVRSLNVISRNSALHYIGRDKTIRQIGKELNVAYVLEGTIRWARSSEGMDRVRITPKLIRVNDDVNIWSDEYDRVISDVFEIQSDIAKNIAKQLAGTLPAPEREAVDVRLTNNLNAYHAYLRGNYLAKSPHFTVENWRQVEKSYERAVNLDPNFALAYAKLAKAHARFIFLWVDISEERRQKAKETAQKALELGSQSGTVHLALSYYYLWAQRNPDEALAELKKAEEKFTDQTEIMNARAYIFEIQGRWEEAITAFQYVSKLNPLDADPPTELAFANWVIRRYEQAIRYSEQAIGLAPNDSWPYLTKIFILWSWKGAKDEARAVLQNVNPSHEWMPWMWFWQETYEGNYQNAVERLKINSNEWIRLKVWARPKKLLTAFAYEMLKQPKLAHACYDSARILLEAEVQKWPDDPRYHSSLGIAYAALDYREKAIAEGKKAVALLPLSSDAFYGLPYVGDMAFIYTLIGDHESALDQLEYLLSIPSWFSKSWLKMDPRWDRLRSQPRFRKMLAESS